MQRAEPQRSCDGICADPDLIAVFSDGSSDKKATQEAREKQIEFIVQCPIRKSFRCKWQKQIGSEEWV